MDEHSGYLPANLMVEDQSSPMAPKGSDWRYRRDRGQSKIVSSGQFLAAPCLPWRRETGSEECHDFFLIGNSHDFSQIIGVSGHVDIGGSNFLILFHGSPHFLGSIMLIFIALLPAFYCLLIALPPSVSLLIIVLNISGVCVLSPRIGAQLLMEGLALSSSMILDPTMFTCGTVGHV